MKQKKSRIITHKIGQLPGSLIYTGSRKDDRDFIEHIIYNEDSVTAKDDSTYDQVVKTIDKDKVNWIHFSSLNHIESVEKIGKLFDVHTLMLEDTLNVEHLPKVEFSEKHVFFTLKILYLNEENLIEQEHVSFILGDYYLISYQEQQGELFGLIKGRIINKIGRIRQMRADYLFYQLIDAIVDNYFITIEYLRKLLEETEDQLIESPIKDFIHEIHHIKKQISFFRKYVFSLREAINNLINEEPDQIASSNYKYLKDVQDHVNHIYESIESYREEQRSLMELNQSNQSNSANQIMKTLTVVAGIFIPLTFIVGVYGMNFRFMPELDWEWGYFGIIGFMVLVSVAMIWYMKRKKWF